MKDAIMLPSHRPGLMQAVAKGTTPAAAQLENSPGENLVVDLTKLGVVQKKALAWQA
ncbi:hypothetical protein QN224_32755 [Sinorhizobium sp. 8-89]|uniref:hypothetical protein n=1 Tax=Sinorhizobium sp. 7-81 TaxID=3049087 RepID=UPI0024C401BE|nr:hypothetical protein [Sinorhizobium sp. 7-81]MDK1390082.1 hypothetical protein [Sinorhizobium sp. 7-81]